MDIRVAAAAIVTDDQGRVLLARWITGSTPSWTTPGGGIDPGEDPVDAVIRELREETGYEVEVGEILGVVSAVIPAHRRIRHEGVPLHSMRIMYRATVVGGELQHEADGSTDMAAWFTLDEVKELHRSRHVDEALRMAGLL